ncbi:MAG: hypothetical protein RL742_419 [Bacteroidota bacterium]
MNAAGLPRAQLLAYAAGLFGWSLTSYSVANLLVYFYMPPQTGAPVFPNYIYQGAVLGILTIVGILSAAGRLFDAVIDPVVANWSDRKKSGMGRRRWFLAVSAVPFAFAACMVFFPITETGSAANTAWLCLWLLLYYFFFTLYYIPYTALIAELGHTADERLRISTAISITWALGFIAGNSLYALQGWFETRGMLPVTAFQSSLLLLSGLGLLGLLIPVFFLRENRYAKQQATETPLVAALQTVFRNKNFRFFLLSDLMYWLALSFIQLGVGFYVTIQLNLDKSYAFVFSLLSFFCSFIFYWPLNVLARKTGKKRLLNAAFGAFALLFFVLAIARRIPAAPEVLLYALGIAAAFPLAVFGILPNALIGDVVEREGPELAGMFYGLRAFVMKVGIAGANLIFPSLLLLGKSADNPAGVQATAWSALLFCAGGWYFFSKYRENPPEITP